MTRYLICAAGVSLVFACAVQAQESKIAVSVLAISPQTSDSETGGTRRDVAWGAGLEVKTSSRFSLAGQYSSQRTVVTHWVTNQNGQFFATTHRASLHPIDITGRYRLGENARWRPYAGVGVRVVDLHVETPPVPFMVAQTSNGWHVEPEVNVGVSYAMHPRVGLEFDAKYALADPHDTGLDKFRGSAGVSFHF